MHSLLLLQKRPTFGVYASRSGTVGTKTGRITPAGGLLILAGHGLSIQRTGHVEWPAMRTAVIGHVEWIQFARVERVPTAGEIIHACETWEEPAGGGGVSAVQMLKLAGWCSLYTALGDDDPGHRAKDGLVALGVAVETTFRPTAQRRGFTFLD